VLGAKPRMGPATRDGELALPVLEESDFAGKHKLTAPHLWAIFAAYRRAGEKSLSTKGGYKPHIPAANNLLLHGVLPQAPPAEPPRGNNSDSDTDTEE